MVDQHSAPRDDLYSPERQLRPGQLDEPQRPIPSEVPVSVHTWGRIEEHGDEDVTQMTVFNDSKKQGWARQGKVDTGRNTGE